MILRAYDVYIQGLKWLHIAQRDWTHSAVKQLHIGTKGKQCLAQEQDISRILDGCLPEFS